MATAVPAITAAGTSVSRNSPQRRNSLQGSSVDSADAVASWDADTVLRIPMRLSSKQTVIPCGFTDQMLMMMILRICYAVSLRQTCRRCHFATLPGIAFTCP